jgi:hypothetical protein
MMQKVIYWLPRILAIGLILFISVFALDAFSLPNWPVALLMHLLPSITLGLTTFIAWKYQKIGGVLFVLIGLTSIFFFRSILLTIPLWLIASLFLVEKKH